MPWPPWSLPKRTQPAGSARLAGGGAVVPLHAQQTLEAPWFWGPLSISASSRRADSSPMVGLNRGQVSDPAAPFGGSKQSGIGREGGHDGMLDYLESKYIAKQG